MIISPKKISIKACAASSLLHQFLFSIMFAFATLYALSAAAAIVSAGPLRPRTCDTSALTMDLPAGQTKLVNPTTAPAFVLLGVGTQNYTCGAAGTYA
jgi:hypothetical protein